ncbi:MAG TPA: hypothetical protein VIS94_03155 [Desulfomonilia bacterium]
MKKAQWKKPELIVLVRHQVEEAVLNGCKGGGSITSFLSHKDGCHSDAPGCTTLCSDPVQS